MLSDKCLFPHEFYLSRAKISILEKVPNFQGSDGPLGESPTIDRWPHNLCSQACGPPVSKCIDLQREGCLQAELFPLYHLLQRPAPPH